MSDKVLTVPKPGDTSNKSTELPPGSIQINNADWQAANAKNQDGKGQAAGFCDCKIIGKLDEKETAKTVEELSKATSTTARLTALGKLADDGVEKFSMKDKDGTTRQFRIETEKVGGSTLLHCYGIDDQKQEQVVMRAARTANGSFTRQRYEDDQLASFHGDTWNKNMSGKSFLVGDFETPVHKQTKTGELEKSNKKIEKHNTTDGERAHGKAHDDRSRNRTSDQGSHGKIRKHESTRERKRGDDDEGNRREHKQVRERSDRRNDGGSRFNIGETLGTVARYVAPFLLSALDRNLYANDCNSYRSQNNFRFDNCGYNVYYDSNRYGYDGFNRGQDFRGRQDHCRDDYDRRYGNRSYYERYGHNQRNDRYGRDNYRHGRHDQNRRSTNWLTKLFR